MPVKYLIQLRRGTAAAWVAANPVLMQCEEGFETDTGLRKIGDGATAWNTLAYAKTAVADALSSATTIVNASLANAPTVGQVLTATSNSSATWQTPVSVLSPPDLFATIMAYG